MNINSNNSERALDIYKIGVQTLAENELDFEFDNSSASHAAVVLANMLDTCKSVKIYDTHLEGDVAYSDNLFLDSLKNFMAKEDRTLNIVIRNHNSKSRLFEEILRIEKKNCNWDVREVSNDFKKSVYKVAGELNYVDINFAVGDNRAYRLEQFDEEHNLKKAKCNFNDVEKSRKLEGIFNSSFEKCNSVITA